MLVELVVRVVKPAEGLMGARGMTGWVIMVVNPGGEMGVAKSAPMELGTDVSWGLFRW